MLNKGNFGTYPLEKLIGGKKQSSPAVVTESSGAKVPPHSLEAEMSVLGAMMLDRMAIAKSVEILEAEAFYREAHVRIYETMTALFERGVNVDIISLSEELRRRGLLEFVGGTYYLTEINAQTPTAANIEHHARIVQERYLKRCLIQVAGTVLNDCYDETSDALEEIDKAETRIFDIAEKRLRRGVVDMGKLARDTFAMITAMMDGQQQEGITGVPSGFTRLDDMLGGFQRSDMIIVAARPSMGKCLSFETEILESNGNLTSIEELFRRKQAHLLTLNEEWKIVPVTPSDYIDDGIKPVFRVTTRLGRTVESTLTHPFLTLHGWQPLAKLQAGTAIAVPRELYVFGTATESSAKITLLAFLIGDGCLTKGTPEFTNSNPVLRDEFARCAETFIGVCARMFDSEETRTPTMRAVKNTAFIQAERVRFAERLQEVFTTAGISVGACAHYLGISQTLVRLWLHGRTIPNDAHFAGLCTYVRIAPEQLAPSGLAPLRKNRKNTLTLWLQDMGIWGKDAYAKYIPPYIFTLNKEGIALFLNRLFATDGWASVLASGQSQIGYATMSEKLARQIQHLLLRFGIVAALKKRAVSYNGGKRTAWQIDITDSRSLSSFARNIGIFGKERQISNVLAAVQSRKMKTNRDLIPTEVWQQIADARCAESWASLGRRAGIKGYTNMHIGKRSVTRSHLLALAVALQHTQLQRLAKSDVYWDSIVAIEYTGMKQVYDLTIPETHNFIANDICVHNTALALSVARNMAVEYHQPVAVFSIEMAATQLMMRLLSAESRINAHIIRTNRLDHDSMPKLVEALGRLAEAPIYIDDSPALTIMEIRAKTRRLKAERNIQAVIVDYLQLIHAPKAESREREISIISRSLKQIAKELDIPVIALAQLNRSVEARSDKTPMLSDLRESGSIEQDADVVMFVNRREQYGIQTYDDGSPTPGTAELIIGKQRNGPTGTVKLAYLKDYARFENLSYQYDEPPPYMDQLPDNSVF